MSLSHRAAAVADPPRGGSPSPGSRTTGRETPVTRVTLLVRLRDGSDADAWREFVHLYGPVVYGFARRRGLQDADAADLMQEVLRSIARHVGTFEYDPRRGTFRGWLFTVTRNKIANFLVGQRNRPRGSGDRTVHEHLDAIPDESADTEGDWDLEYQRQVSAKAMDVVKPEFQATTWKAFWGTAVEGRPAQEVGAELAMTPGAVYVAKSRVLARLREEVQRMQAEAEAW